MGAQDDYKQEVRRWPTCELVKAIARSMLDCHEDSQHSDGRFPQADPDWKRAYVEEELNLRIPPLRHVTGVEVDKVSLRRGGSCRVAACACGWFGPERSTMELAADDALEHEKAST